MRRIFVVVPLLLAASCSPSARTHNVLPDEKFASLHASLLETVEAQRQAGFDSARCRSGVDSVLLHAGVTRDEFMATLTALNEDLVRWRTVSETTMRILEERSVARQERR